MDVVRNYSEETLSTLLSQSKQALDYLQLLMMSAEDSEHFQKEILPRIADIQQMTHSIDTKVDTVLQKLLAIEAEFKDVKTQFRGIEEKISLMTSKLSRLENSISVEEIEDYSVLAESLYSNWDSLDDLTKKFIPLAEYLYSQLQKINDADFSPVIIELCRAIENEFLLKVFKKYTVDLINRQKNNLDRFLSTDRSSRYLSDKTNEFVKTINKASYSRRVELTLGQMNKILSLLNDSRALAESPLLKDFDDYLHFNTEAARLLDPGYMDKISDLVKNYRNPSAHPDMMSIQKANKCREFMPDRIDYFVSCVS